MTRKPISTMRPSLYSVAGDMLHEEFYGVSKKLHDADEYHIERATHSSSDKLSEIIAEVSEKNGIEVDNYYIVHLYSNFCMLIIPYNFSAETSQKFSEELNLVAKHHGIEDVFGRTGELSLSYWFKDYWFFPYQRLEECVDLLKNSFFRIN